MRRSVQCLLLLGLITLFFGAQANAASSNLVIYQVQAGAVSTEPSASSQEFVTIYNNGTHDIDVTNWCLVNKSDNFTKAFACVTPSMANQTLHVPSRGYMIIASDTFALAHTNYRADIIYPITNGVITGSSDTISLRDAQKNVIDTVSWSTSLSGGTILQRLFSTDGVLLIDTDMASDFTKVQTATLPVGSLYETITVVDACSNIPEIQEEIPSGFLKNDVGDCTFDACSNIDGLQVDIPQEFVRRAGNDCIFNYVALKITELLPNAAGSDNGREYIEIYNPSERDAFLANYFLRVGDKTYNFPASLKLGPGQYMAFYNNEITFTFLNTTSHVTLLGDDGSIIDQSDVYNDPKDDMAWALIGEKWQYTNQMTFAAANIASVFEPEDVELSSELQPCAANQYRHPQTNRCRSLVVQSSVVAACKDGQYRSEETNRCRAIALAGGTLTPCKENQYRSEETNRCRNIATAASTLTPCKDNQYRSEETNRCRTLPAASAPPAAFAIEPIADSGATFVGWWTLGGIGMLAIGYGAWEWHREIFAGLRKVLSFFPQR